MDDLRTPTIGCANAGADNISVATNVDETSTSADGTFVLENATGLVRASRADIETSLATVGDPFEIPAITTIDYAALVSANLAVLQAGQGSLHVRVQRAGVPVSGVVASIAPAAANEPYYDGTSATVWERTMTGAAGIVWIPGAVAGTNVVTISGTAATFTVQGGSITYAILELP